MPKKRARRWRWRWKKAVKQSEVQILLSLYGAPNVQQICEIRAMKNSRFAVATKDAGRALNAGVISGVTEAAAATVVEQINILNGNGREIFEKYKWRFRRDMRAALRSLLAVGYEHCDLLPRNVCWDAVEKRFTLIDFGKMRKTREWGVEETLCAMEKKFNSDNVWRI